MNAYERTIGDAALRQFGRVGNLLKAMEEFAELQQALCRHMAAPDDALVLANVHEEIADAWIMLNRMSMMFDNMEIADWKDSKLDRTARLLGLEVRESECGEACDAKGAGA